MKKARREKLAAETRIQQLYQQTLDRGSVEPNKEYAEVASEIVEEAIAKGFTHITLRNPETDSSFSIIPHEDYLLQTTEVGNGR